MNQRYDASLLNFPPTPSSCLSVYFWFMHCSVCRLHLNNQGGKIDMLGRVLSQLFKIQNVSSRMMVKWLESIDFCFLSWGSESVSQSKPCENLWESLWESLLTKALLLDLLDSSTLTLSHVFASDPLVPRFWSWGHYHLWVFSAGTWEFPRLLLLCEPCLTLCTLQVFLSFLLLF